MNARSDYRILKSFELFYVRSLRYRYDFFQVVLNSYGIMKGVGNVRREEVYNKLMKFTVICGVEIYGEGDGTKQTCC